MDYYSNQISRLIEEFSRLPGIGNKSAQRLAFHVINMPVEQVEGLANAIVDARKNVRYCKECCTLTDKDICPICSNPDRDHKTIMVVETPRDLAAYEKTGKYNGVYHVLHGAISPMLGIGPGDIRLKELMERLQGDVDEVIIATNSSLEGETTAMYISKLIKPVGIKVIARIDQSKRAQPFKFCMIGISTFGLRRLFRVPVQAEPVQITLKCFNVLQPAPVWVQIFNPQQHSSVPASHGEPRQKRGKHVSEVHPAAGAGCKTSGQHIGLSSLKKRQGHPCRLYL